MSLVIVYRDNDGDLVEMTDRVRRGSIEVVTHAEEGSVGRQAEGRAAARSRNGRVRMGFRRGKPCAPGCRHLIGLPPFR